MPNVIKLNKKVLLDDLDLPGEAIHEEIVGKRRWSTDYWIVFEYQGKFWGCSYSSGNTEYQDEYPWDNEEEVECTEVHKVPVTTEEWRVKE